MLLIQKWERCEFQVDLDIVYIYANVFWDL